MSTQNSMAPQGLDLLAMFSLEIVYSVSRPVREILEPSSQNRRLPARTEFILFEPRVTRRSSNLWVQRDQRTEGAPLSICEGGLFIDSIPLNYCCILKSNPPRLRF